MGHTPKFTDCLLQITLVKIGDGSVEDSLDVVLIDLVDHVREYLDCLVVLLRLQVLFSFNHQLLDFVLLLLGRLSNLRNALHRLIVDATTRVFARTLN